MMIEDEGRDLEIKISVIVPIYNTARYIKSCLDSILKQTLKEIEVICINDGSSDNSLKILKGYSSKDARVKVIDQENKGTAAAKNAGLKEVKGEFIAFMDSDDFYPSSDVLEKLYNTALEHHVDVCGGSRLMTVDAEGKQMNLRDNFFAGRAQPISYIETQQDFGYTLYIYRTELIKNNNISFPLYTFWEDPVFLVNVMYAASKFYCIPEVVYCYRKNHKKRFFTEENVFHLLSGCYDNLHFAKEHHLKILFEKTVERLKKEYNHVVAEYNTGRVKNLKEKIIGICTRYSRENFKRFNRPVYVSIIVPVYNSAAYLEECLQSICDQTLKEIEIICINDGSTDDSLKIIKEFALKDERIRYVDKPNSGYGNVINIGLSLAMGEYVGIVESDDYIVPSMYETLYKAAAPENLDIVKGNFKRFYGEKNNRRFEDVYISRNGSFYGKILSTEREIDLFRVNNINCNGLFRKEFVEENHIRLNETPGASYQDNGLWFQAFTFAKKILLLPDFLYMVRRDNPNSSVKSAGKVYCICDEAAFIHEILSRKNCPKEVMAMLWQRMFGNYIWRYNRIAPEFKLQFLKRFYADFYAAKENGELDFSLFSAKEREMLNLLFTNYKLLHAKLQKRRKETGTYKRGVELFYRKVTGKCLDLNNPQTFNEKIQWLKLYDSTPIKTRLADKYLVREWVKEKIGERYLIPLLGVYDRFEDIDFSQLPNQFVIKCNHGCGYNIIVKDRSQFDVVAAKLKVNRWMRENFAFKGGFELHYRDIKPKILIETYLENEGTRDLHDYKFFCFNGKVTYIEFLSERNLSGLKVAFYNRQWEKQNFTTSHPLDTKNIPKPINLELMIQLAEKLSAEFNYVRVDFYLLNDGEIKFGEMTFTPASGVSRWSDPQIDLSMGQQIKLPELAYNIDTGEYYRPKRSSKLPFYLHFPLNWYKKHHLLRKFKSLSINYIQNQLHQVRIDIKNIGTAKNAVVIEAENSTVSEPGWFCNTRGRGQVLTSPANREKIKIHIISDGKLTVSFLGADMCFEGKRFPIWIDYKSIKIDGMEILSSPVATWHDEPWRYEMPVKDGQEIWIEYEQQAHPYSRMELKETILKLNPTSDVIQENIDALTDEIENNIVQNQSPREREKEENKGAQRTENVRRDCRNIQVQNAEGEPDTTAYVIEQNKIDYVPKVSVIIPVYNAEAYLRECLDSVVNQTLKEIEIICIDDGSTDSSLSILKEYAQKDPRISVLQQENLHAGVARNAGIAVARGKYIHFLDSDDWVDADTYKELAALMDKLCVEILKFRSFAFDNQKKKIVSTYYTDMKALRENDFEKGYSFNRDYELLIHCSDVPWSGFYSRLFLLRHNVRFDNLLCANDTSFFYRCLVNARNIYITKERFVYHRINNPFSLIGIRAYHFDCQIRLFFIILNIIRASQLNIIKSVRACLIENVYFCYSVYINNPHLEKSCKDKIRALVKGFNTHICRNELKREYLIYFDDIQGRNPYLRVLFNWCKKYYLLKKGKSLCIKHIQAQLRQIRIDIKNVGTAKNSVAIEAENSTVSEPGWFKNAQGAGQVLRSSTRREKIEISIIAAGKLMLTFRGPDEHFEGERFPLWNDYKSIKIDGKEILSSPIAVWHDKPWRYEMPVEDGQEVWIEYEQQAHSYSREELRETILKLNPMSEVIHENINALTDEVYKTISQANNPLNQMRT